MPYTDPETRRAYAREWLAARRAAFFDGKCCIDCGATDSLELDHSDPDLKVCHRVWSWAQERREAELAKCVVRCGPCHRERHAVLRRFHGLGGYRRGCRCDVCRLASSASKERYRARAQPRPKGWTARDEFFLNLEPVSVWRARQAAGR